jgi:protein KTI12
MWDCLVLKKVAPPNAATLVKPTSGNNFLQELDQKTQAVISAIVQHQQIASIGGQVKVEDMVIEMPAHAVSTAQLQRIRRTFVALNRMRSIDIDRITSLFVEYINRTFESE